MVELSDSVLIRAVARGKLLSPDQIAELLLIPGDRPLAVVLRELGWVKEEALLAWISQGDVATRVARPADSHDTPVVPSSTQETSPSRRTFGKYVLTGRLGHGGMGEVWRAQHFELGRVVALKLLLSAGDEERARFRREAQLASSLSHPNMPVIYEVGEEGGRPFLAMQLIEGQTLASARLPIRRVLEVMRDAAEAVNHAHIRGIVHRDIKPQNLMLDSTGRVFVMDFGLARGARTGAGTPTLTVSGEILGTPAYMAPEQARGLNALVGPRTDVWSLGATLYELLTGLAPFNGSNPHEIMAKIGTQDPVRPRQLVPSVDRDVETIVLKCLERDPAQRYPSAGELAADLARTLRGEPIQARPVRALERLGRAAVRRPGLMAVGALIVLGIATAALLGAPPQPVDPLSIRARYDAALAAGAFERAESARVDLAKVDRRMAADLENGSKALIEAEAASRRADSREATEIGLACVAGSRDHAVALLGMAVGLDPRNREARDRLAGMLSEGPASGRLLGPAAGEARVDLIVEPADARIEIFPPCSLPIVRPGQLAIRVRTETSEAWIAMSPRDGESLKWRVRVPSTPVPQGMFFCSDGAGGGCFLGNHIVTREEYAAFLAATGRAGSALQQQPGAAMSLGNARAYAAWQGCRLPTKEELNRSRSCWNLSACGVGPQIVPGAGSWTMESPEKPGELGCLRLAKDEK